MARTPIRIIIHLSQLVMATSTLEVEKVSQGYWRVCIREGGGGHFRGLEVTAVHQGHGRCVKTFSLPRLSPPLFSS